MKTKIFSTLAASVLLLAAQACHDPEVLESNGDSRGILGITAKIVGDDTSENSFSSVIDYDNHTITVVFPINYPRPSDELFNADMMANVRLTASLATNATIEPNLTTMDLRKTNYITVTNAQKVKTVYTVKGDIRPSTECELKEVELSDGTPGIVDNESHIIYLVTAETIEKQTAQYELSYHATMVPDIATEEFDFEGENPTVTIVAQDGTTKQDYKFVKGEPNRLKYGIRDGSQKLQWVKKWTELGYTGQASSGAQTGIGVTEKYLVLNQKGVMRATIINAKDGSDTGMKLDMSIIPNGMNHNMTSDCAGHILVNSLYNEGAASLMKVWLFKDINDPGTELMSVNAYGSGGRISVYGDVTKDAVIVAPLNGTNIQFCRWFVKDGVVGSAQTVTMAGVASTPWYNVDIAPTSATDDKADYFSAFYAVINGKRGPVLFNGTNNTAKSIGLPNTKKRNEGDGGLEDAGNWVMNACDYREFNNSKYFIHNSVNTFSWGENDMIWLLDVSGGTLETDCVDMYCDGIAPDGKEHHGVDVNFNYGAMAAGYMGVASNNNDVRLWVSDNGFFMYGYFFFANGYLGRVRVDCIKY